MNNGRHEQGCTRVGQHEQKPVRTTTKGNEGQPKQRRKTTRETCKGRNELRKHNGAVGEVEEARGKPTPPPSALVGHGKRNDELGEHGIMHINVSAVK